jgi:hypothetical protein
VTAADLIKQIESRDAEIARLREEVARLLDPNIVALNVRDGGLDMALEGTSCRLFAESFASEFQRGGGVNYLECRFTSQEVMPGEAFVVTVQRVNGKTPHQLRADAESELAALRARIAAAPVTSLSWIDGREWRSDGVPDRALADVSGQRVRLLRDDDAAEAASG